METWKQHLKDYMLAKSKPRDLVVFTTFLNIKLIAILQDVKDVIETYEDFTTDLKRKRFGESYTFPLEASTFLIRYKSDELIEFNFSWILDSEGDIHLNVTLTDFCHRRFDADLVDMMGEKPEWLENCISCEPFSKDLGLADDMKEETLAWFVVDCFCKVTKNYLL